MPASSSPSRTFGGVFLRGNGTPRTVLRPFDDRVCGHDGAGLYLAKPLEKLHFAVTVRRVALATKNPLELLDR